METEKTLYQILLERCKELGLNKRQTPTVNHDNYNARLDADYLDIREMYGCFGYEDVSDPEEYIGLNSPDDQ